MRKKSVESREVLRRTLLTLGLLMLFLAAAAYGLRWLDGSTGYDNVAPGKKEKAWLKRLNRPIVVGMTTIPNQVIETSQGTYDGFAPQLYTLFEKYLDISFSYRYYETWQALMDAAERREVDIVFLAQRTPSRLRFFDFTDTVLTLKNKIIVSENKVLPKNVGDFEGLRVAVVKGSAVEEYVKNRFKHIVIVDTKDEYAALLALKRDRADVALMEPVRAQYYIRKHRLKGLYVAGDLGFDYYLSAATRNDMPMLNVLINKTLKRIPDETLESLRLQWGYVDGSGGIDAQTLIYLALAFGVIVPFAGYLYYTNQKLAFESEARRKAISQLNLLLEEREKLGEILERRIAEEVEKNRQQELYMLHQNRLAQMGELLSMIAHQWRQPLYTISLINYVFLKKVRQGQYDLQVLNEYEAQSRRLLEHMSKTIDDFRDFLDPVHEKRHFDVTEIINETVEMIKPMFERYEIDIRMYLPPGRVTLYGYPSGLAQALLNIVNNAKDALLERDIPQKRVSFYVVVEGTYVSVVIEDNAGGIPEEIIERIFDPYFSTKREKNGTGLGLYMSKKIVERQFKGELFAENGTQGARFTLRFPLSSEDD